MRAPVSLAEAQILAELSRARSVLEIGGGCGVSTSAMAYAAKSLVSVEPCDEVRGTVFLPRVEFVKHISEVSGLFDMVFIDGLHDERSVAIDTEEANRRLRPGGVLVWHDVNNGHLGVDSFLESSGYMDEGIYFRTENGLLLWKDSMR